MMKLVYCLRRKPNMSRAEFQAYWRNTHAPLVQQHAAALQIRRYVQTHTLDHSMNERGATGQVDQDAFDGVAELWWDSADALQAAFASTEGAPALEALVEDEEKFIDRERSPRWIAEEKPIIDH
jgi:uncharacterized protein (TIGR02118 family)